MEQGKGLQGSADLFNIGGSKVVLLEPPQPVYNMVRTLSTALEDVKGAEMPVCLEAMTCIVRS